MHKDRCPIQIIGRIVQFRRKWWQYVFPLKKTIAFRSTEDCQLGVTGMVSIVPVKYTDGTRGLVKVTVAPEDRRGRLLALTPAGRKLLARALPLWKRHHRELEKRLSAPDMLRSDLMVLAR